jgi:hypothetical protein
MSEKNIPSDIREVADQLAIRLRFDLAGISRAAATVWATDGAIARVNDAFAEAILAERQKHERPASPDLQAEAERVFADVQREVLLEDAKAVIAKALQAAEQRGKDTAGAKYLNVITEIDWLEGYTGERAFHASAIKAAIIKRLLAGA